MIGTQHTSARWLWALAFALLAPLLGCTQKGFECGVAAADDPEVIRRCDRPGEICVCATHACAAPDRRQPLDAGTHARGGDGTREEAPCSSGFRYTEAPFADPELAGTCVPPVYAPPRGAVIQAASVGLACEARDAGGSDEDGGAP